MGARTQEALRRTRLTDPVVAGPHEGHSSSERTVRAAICLLLCSATWSLACSDEVSFVPLELDARSVAVLARTSATGELLELTLVTGEQDPVFLEASTGDVVHVFSLEAEALLRFDGRSLDGEELRTLRATRPSPQEAPDRCLACPIPVDVAPLLLGPGYSCALPLFAEHRAQPFLGEPIAEEDIEVDALRRSIRLEWPGPCPCSRERPPVVNGPSSRCFADETPGPRRWSKLAIGDDGSVVALHPTELFAATASGAISRFPFNPPMFVPAGVGASAGPSARALAFGLVLGDRPDVDSVQRVIELAEDGPRQVELPAPPAVSWQGVLRDPARQALYFVGGSDDAPPRVVLRCDEPLRDCAVEPLEECERGQPARGSVLGSAALTAEGALVAPRPDGNLQVKAPGASVWRCVQGDPPELRSGGPSFFLSGIQRSLVVGDRLFHCGVASSDPDALMLDTHYVATSKLRPSGSPWNDGPIEIHSGASEQSACAGLWHDRAGARVYAFFSNTRTFTLRFDEAGRFLGEGFDAPYPSLEEPVALVAESHDRRNLVIMGESGALHLARDRGPLTPLGPPRPAGPAHAISVGEEVVVLGGDHEPRRWSGACEEGALTPAAPLGMHLLAAASLPEGEVLGAGQGELIRYAPSQGVLQRWDVDLPELQSLAHLAGSDVLLLDAQGRAHVFSMASGASRPLRVERHPGEVAADVPAFRHLSARDGVAWLSADHQLARVRYDLDGPRAELWWTDAITSALEAEDTLVGAFGPVVVPCSGSAIVFVRRRIPQFQDVAYFVARLHAIEADASGRQYETPPLPGLARPVRGAAFGRRPTRMSSGTNPIVVFNDGLMLRPDTSPWYLSHPEVTSIAEVGTRYVVGTSAGGLEFYRTP